MKLEKYNKKRNFNSTNEPEGKVDKKNLNRFVIQYHKATKTHYDFRLEFDGVLLSFAVPKGLSKNPLDKRLAVHVEDHPISYIDFEGIIPKGNYGAGSVEIYDNGNYEPLNDFKLGLKKGHLKFFLNGKKLIGAWSLIKMDEKNWLIVKAEDEYASSKSQESKLPFKTASVQLATLTKDIPKGKDWLFEIKYDGYRMLGFCQDKKAKLFSRNNIDYTKKFSSIAKSLEEIEEDNFVVDGEVVCFDENGKSDFGLLQTSIRQKKDNNLCYVIFDLLAFHGKDLRDTPLDKRKEKLQFLLNKAKPNLMYSTHIKNNGEKCFDFAKKNNLEGIIAKRSSSKYLGTRSDDWLKIKCYLRQEFIILGFTKSEKSEIFSALLLGYYNKNTLTYVGKVGTGFSIDLKKLLIKKFKKIITDTPKLNKKFKEEIIWLKPELVCEIQFAEITKDNLLRQASFIGLREDKKASDVVLEFKK